ncbi:DUF1929 domain-containing protein [Ectothiorhodospiraceae bacterium 2226]|nr:DUF1929 domain-containing protein [Ectothiorhodospiraceae bacterium 2226]
MDFVPIHMALLHTGDVLLFSGDQADINNASAGKCRLWHPETGRVTTLALSRNLFCAGHCFLSDGRLLAAGGTTHGFPGRSGADKDLHTFMPPVVGDDRGDGGGGGPGDDAGRGTGGGTGGGDSGGGGSGGGSGGDAGGGSGGGGIGDGPGSGGIGDGPGSGPVLNIAGLQPLGSHTGGWQRHADMDDRRWYPTCTTLPDGKALIVSGVRRWWFAGLPRLSGRVNKTQEIFDPDTNRLSPPQHFLDDVGLYPFVHVLPGGYLFVHYRDTTRLRDLHRNRWLPQTFHTVPVNSDGSRGTHTYDGTGACAVLPLDADGNDPHKPGVVRILLVGGSTDAKPSSGSPATDVAQVFEFVRERPQESGWRATARLHHRRFMSDATLLPNGQVLVSGGAGRGRQGHSHNGVREAELFDPADETFGRAAEAAVDRLYHSTALLMPDARVLQAGSTGHEWPADADSEANDLSLELYTPPYCRHDAPVPHGPRIRRAPSTLGYATRVTVETPDADSVVSVALLRTGSVTHTLNMDQRCVMLPIVSRTSEALTVTTPRDGWVAPPGPYMLFLIAAEGCVSHGAFVRFDAPAAAVDISPTRVNFGATPVGEVATRTVTLRNSGRDTLTLTVSEPEGGFAWDAFSITVRAGEERDVTIHFAPLGPGTHAALLRITTSAPNLPQLEVPIHGEGMQGPQPH